MQELDETHYEDFHVKGDIDYEEIKLNVYREVTCFSLLFFSFFAGNLYYTGHLFGWHKIRQRKIKIRKQYLNEYNYRLEWVKQYKWRTI